MFILLVQKFIEELNYVNFTLHTELGGKYSGKKRNEINSFALTFTNSNHQFSDNILRPHRHQLNLSLLPCNWTCKDSFILGRVPAGSKALFLWLLKASRRHWSGLGNSKVGINRRAEASLSLSPFSSSSVTTVLQNHQSCATIHFILSALIRQFYMSVLIGGAYWST